MKKTTIKKEIEETHFQCDLCDQNFTSEYAAGIHLRDTHTYQQKIDNPLKTGYYQNSDTFYWINNKESGRLFVEAQSLITSATVLHWESVGLYYLECEDVGIGYPTKSIWHLRHINHIIRNKQEQIDKLNKDIKILSDLESDKIYSKMMPTVEISSNLDRTKLMELGRKVPYYKYTNFPVEIQCDIEIIDEKLYNEIFRDNK